MKARLLKTILAEILRNRANVGALLDMCDENYRLIKKLSPNLEEMTGLYRCSAEGHLDLYLEILEQTPYTTLARLTHYFETDEQHAPEPDVVVRVYHDARQVEVLDLKQSVMPSWRGAQLPSLDQKWKINIFLYKWLGYCLRHHYRFDGRAQSDSHRLLPRIASC